MTIWENHICYIWDDETILKSADLRIRSEKNTTIFEGSYDDDCWTENKEKRDICPIKKDANGYNYKRQMKKLITKTKNRSKASNKSLYWANNDSE